MSFDPVIFREYDIRGIYEKHFNLEFARSLGQAFVTYIYNKNKVAQPTVSIGHDARLSSGDIVDALCQGITSAGGNVVRLGLVTTPMTYFSTFTMNQLAGSIMVTGSHNPPDYNGFKLSVGQSTLFGEEIQALKKIIQSGDMCSGQGRIESYDIFPSYVERYKKEFGELAPVPIVIDCGNGTAGVVVRRLYEAIGLNPHILFEEPDGRFPNHHPDPTVEENLTALKAAVRERQAVVGIGFDGDSDRIGIVDDKGQMVLGDEIIALCSRYILRQQPGQTIVGDVKCSDRMFEDIRKHGGNAIMWKTGHSLIKEKIKAENAPFGGELSGHIFFNDRNYGYDDALYAGLRVIEILSQTGRSLSELLSDLPSAFNTPEIRVDTTEEKKVSIVARLKEAFRSDTEEYKVDFTDGVRISFADGWALVRSSNTQPVLVMRFESQTEVGLAAIRARVEKIVRPLL